MLARPISDKNLQIDALDGLRGVAILFVLFSHFSNANMHIIPGFSLSGIGKTGVFLFFILSSFLLTRPFLDKKIEDFKRMELWWHYLKRRFLRIFPLFLFVLILSYLSAPYLLKYTRGQGFPFAISSRDFIDHLVLRAGKSVLWSIPVEVKFYLVLPFLSFAFVLLKKRMIYFCLTILTLIIISISIWPPGLSEENSYFLGPYLPVFLLGSFSAAIHGRMGESFKSLYEGIAIITLLVIVSTTPTIFSFFTKNKIAPTHFSREFFFYGLIWSIFLLSLLHGRGYLKKCLTFWPFRYLGLISFSVYLWHMSILNAIGYFLGNFHPTLQALSAVVITMIISTASYLSIEKPFLELGVKRIRN